MCSNNPCNLRPPPLPPSTLPVRSWRAPSRLLLHLGGAVSPSMTHVILSYACPKQSYRIPYKPPAYHVTDATKLSLSYASIVQVWTLVCMVSTGVDGGLRIRAQGSGNGEREVTRQYRLAVRRRTVWGVYIDNNVNNFLMRSQTNLEKTLKIKL